MPCKGCQGNCKQWAVSNQSHQAGYKHRTRCRTCVVYFPKGLIVCPCCGSKLKTKPRKRYLLNI